MSEVVKFVFYYGPGTVRSNEQGIDLSEYLHVEWPFPSPERLSLIQFQQWLLGSFSLNPQIWDVSIQSL